MLLSIFTPTHNPQWLLALKASIEAQVAHDFCQLERMDWDWEWVIVANSGARVDWPKHPKIRIIEAPAQVIGVGALKRLACQLCQGEVLVEVDHDDLLTPDCLSRLAQAFTANPAVGFVYSNCAKLHEGFTGFGEQYGWKHRTVFHEGKPYLEPLSFGPSALSLSRIWFAPDHIRSWRAKTYWEVGGHDPDLQVCDDHDLLVRTFLHSRMLHLDRCLYLQRVHGANTSWARNKEIQDGTLAVYAKYAARLACREQEVPPTGRQPLLVLTK